ncbi:T6SS effector amidase Tae4 family protein [Mixta gaviniae]|uniref:T6SS effector amidase Tae4 family protein n=1 Tax=Mixta gaviniae TaxID=665914 RepID=UPI0024819CD2|nr:T6SS effector amidase Tae4 family protein [Mixta gaviniae]
MVRKRNEQAKFFTSDFKGLNGILIFIVDSWSDASGHATLWNGSLCSDHCYFPQASKAALWVLK